MKFARPLLITLGIFIALVGVLIGVALLPGVQRWAVLRAAGDVPGLNLAVAEVSVGFSGLTLQKLVAEQHRVKVSMDRLDADFSLVHFLLNRQLAIKQLKISGLILDASKVSRTKAEAAAIGAPAAAPGLLGQLELPLDLRLEDVRIEGQALVPGAAGQPAVNAEFSISGGKFSPGQEGTLQLTATLRNPVPSAAVTTLRAQAGLRATLTSQRTFNNINLTTVIDAEGPSLSGQSQLKISADVYRSLAGENYVVGVDTIMRGATEKALKVSAQLASASRQFAGEWDLNARTAQLQPFFLGGLLPDFDFKGAGNFAFDPHAVSFTLLGGLKGQVSKLEVLDPAWRPLGTITVDTTFDLAQAEGILSLNQFKAIVGGAKPVLDINTTSAIRYDLTKRLLLGNNFGGEKLFHVNLQGLPLDWIRPFVTAVDVSGGLITGQLDLLRSQVGSNIIPLVKGELRVADLNVVQVGRPLLMKASIEVRTEATFSDGVITAPVLDVKVATGEGDSLSVSGKLTADTAPAGPITFTGRFNAATAKMLARWFPGSPVTAQGDLDLTLRGSTIDIQPGSISARQGTDKALISATVNQPFSFNLDTHALVPRNGALPILRLELGRLPLGMLPVTEPDTTMGGFIQQGDFEISVRDEKIHIRATTPFKLADVSLSQGRQKFLIGLQLDATPVIEYSAASGLKVTSGDLTLRNNARAPLAALKGELVQTPGQDTKATMTFNVEIPALASQPMFNGVQSVSAGRASGEVRAALGTQTHFEARMTLNGLMSAGSRQSFPVANVSFRAVVNPNGTVSLQVPLLLDNAGRRSDLNLAMELSPLGTGYSVDGRVFGQQMELEDVMNVLGVFIATAAPDSLDKPAAPVSVTPDTVSAWSRFSGQMSLDIKSITRGQEWAMTGLTGRLAIEPSRLALEKLEAAFSETSLLKAKMEMRFTGGPMPYRLTGDYSLNDFDVGKLFKAIDPSKPPTVEGLFTVNSKLSGNGETPARAIERLHGDFQLTSRQGIFRGLQRASGKVSMATKTVDAVGALASLFGSDKIKQTAEKVAGQTYHVDQLAQSLGEFNYDLLSVNLTRDELLNMNLQDISLVSQEIRFNGRGNVTYVVGKPLLEQPLTASLNFSALGKVEQLLGKLRLLDGTKDELGYGRTKETITIGGTLAKPDPSGFFTKIASAKLSEFLDSEN